MTEQTRKRLTRNSKRRAIRRNGNTDSPAWQAHEAIRNAKNLAEHKRAKARQQVAETASWALALFDKFNSAA